MKNKGKSKKLNTANLNKKNLLTKSPCDFEPIFAIKYIYWHVERQKFVIKCRVTRWHCYPFAQKWPKPNLDTTFNRRTIFWYKRNFSLMHQINVMIFLSSADPLSLLFYYILFLGQRFEEDNKFITLIWCIEENFHLQKSGVIKGFLYQKGCPNLASFIFWQKDNSPTWLPCIEWQIVGVGHYQR